jgi:Fe-S-cluster containining protein
MLYNALNDMLEEDQMFRCQKCGTCCRGYGGTFITDEDIQTISVYIGVDPGTFVESFCRLSGGKPVLAQQKSEFCIFWDEVCTIHPVKPRMCREWPFIRSVLVDPQNWYIMAASCPGIRKNVPVDLVQAYIRGLKSVD